MSVSITLRTSARILRQLLHDRQTIAMMLVVPIVLLVLLYYMFDGLIFNRVALVMLGVFPFIVMFLVTSIAMLRERTSGTLERLFTTPIGKADLLFGYGIAFGIAAAVQAVIATLMTVFVLGLETAGSMWLVVLIAVTDALLGVALGLFFSAFAKTEFQAVQFMPIVAFPQLLLCGLFVARDDMVDWLKGISDVLPLTYAVEALQEVGAHADPTAVLWRDWGIVAGVVMLALLVGAATLRRRTR